MSRHNLVSVLKTLLKNGREQKQLKTRELAQLLGIDQALISKFENGSRKPTKEQVLKLATILEIDHEKIMVTWLKEKIIHEVGDEKLALEALAEAQEEIKHLRNTSLNSVSKALQQLLDEVDLLKSKLDRFRSFESSKVIELIDLEFTFENNRLEGNTLSFQEIDLVINQGLTIPGKTMKEHLEVINHVEALSYVRSLAEKNISFTEKELLSLHHSLARGIQLDDAGKYRKTEIKIDSFDSRFTHPDQLTKEINELFNWYEGHKNTIHPVILAAETHLKLYKIQPFNNSNGKTTRLVQSLILQQHGYVNATINGDFQNQSNYVNLIIQAINTGNKEAFISFIAKTEKDSLERYIGKIAQ